MTEPTCTGCGHPTDRHTTDTETRCWSGYLKGDPCQCTQAVDVEGALW